MSRPAAAERLNQASEVEKFDEAAPEYEALLERSVQASGESPEYFQRHKVQALLERHALEPILDYGCGTGGVTQHLARAFSDVHAFDPSADSLKVAQARAGGVTYYAESTAIPTSVFGSVLIAGVMHHIPPAERDGALSTLLSALRPGGRVFIFEHNPLNPLTRRAVAQCAFDDDAVLLWPRELKRRLLRAGFKNVTQEFVLFFPRAFAPLRPLEKLLTWCPLGAQTLTIAERK